MGNVLRYQRMTSRAFVRLKPRTVDLLGIPGIFSYPHRGSQVMCFRYRAILSVFGCWGIPRSSKRINIPLHSQEIHDHIRRNGYVQIWLAGLFNCDASQLKSFSIYRQFIYREVAFLLNLIQHLCPPPSIPRADPGPLILLQDALVPK